MFSPRVRAETRDGLITLMIQSAVPEDSGLYRILVRNQASSIESECTLNVYQAITTSATAPIFTTSVKGMNFRTITQLKSDDCAICVTIFHICIQIEVSSKLFDVSVF